MRECRGARFLEVAGTLRRNVSMRVPARVPLEDTMPLVGDGFPFGSTGER